MIGYKLWSLALARIAAALGVVCVAIDYRNFPQVRVGSMVEDVDAALDAVFTCPAVVEVSAMTTPLYNLKLGLMQAGGDTRFVYVMGQSAGAQLATCVTIDR